MPFNTRADNKIIFKYISYIEYIALLFFFLYQEPLYLYRCILLSRKGLRHPFLKSPYR